MNTHVLAFHTSITGMPAMGLSGSSCAAQFVMSFAPTTRQTSVLSMSGFTFARRIPCRAQT